MFTFSWSPYPSDETIHKAVLAGQGNYIKNYHYHPIVLGSVLRSSNNLPGPSYRDIKAQTVINRDGTGAPANKAEIKDNQVFLNDVLIATAPAGKSKAQKEKFCKAVVWSLMNDPISLQDKLLEISNQDKPEIIQETIPEIVPAILTSEDITGYPEFKHYEDLNLTCDERCDLIEMSYDDHETFDIDRESDIVHTENLKEILPEIMPEITRSVFSVISTRFIPWLNLTITEEVYA